VETDDDILQILSMVENPSNSPHLEKNSSRALSRTSVAAARLSSAEPRELSQEKRSGAGLVAYKS